MVKRYISMIENHISGNLYNELFSESSEEKCTVFQSMAWFLIVNKLFSKHFPPSFPLSNLYFLFHQGKAASAIPQPSVHHLTRKKGVLKILQISQENTYFADHLRTAAFVLYKFPSFSFIFKNTSIIST